jgi:methylenetetrahydrofolate reductase (NADPH)
MASVPAADARGRAAVRALLAAPRFELLPLSNVDVQAAFLPPGATVSVTASPAKGIEATVGVAGRLAARGFDVIAHLSARMIRDRAHLRVLLGRLTDAGVDRAFVVGGDADDPGAFLDGLSLLRAISELDSPLREIGVPAYPEGHPDIPGDRLLAALEAKQPYASYFVTQLCFDHRAIERWLRMRRAEGITLPAVIGLPGVTELRKLLSISARIGVADSRRFLRKNTRLVGRLVRPGGYDPDSLLTGLAPLLLDPGLAITGAHLYTFNQAETTEAWRRSYLAALGEVANAAETRARRTAEADAS